jgi:hypothetical protein
MRALAVAALMMTFTVILAGCGGVKAPMGIDNRAMLKEASTMSDTLVFINPQVTHTKYTKFILESVAIYDKEDHDFGDIEPADRQMMADFVRDEFVNAFKDSAFPLVKTPAQDTLKVQFTLVGLTRSVPVVQGLNYVAFPYGTAIQVIKGAQGKPGTFMGNAVVAVEFNDSLNNELIAALVTRQSAGAFDFKAAFDGKYGASKAGITRFMQLIRKKADESHGFGM